LSRAGSPSSALAYIGLDGLALTVRLGPPDAEISQRILRGLAQLDEFLACWPLIAEGRGLGVPLRATVRVWSSCAMRALM
jgi:hypothetical protein